MTAGFHKMCIEFIIFDRDLRRTEIVNLTINVFTFYHITRTSSCRLKLNIWKQIVTTIQGQQSTLYLLSTNQTRSNTHTHTHTHTHRESQIKTHTGPKHISDFGCPLIYVFQNINNNKA